MTENLIEAMMELREEEALIIVQERLQRGDKPAEILDDAREAMKIVGERFEKQHYFLPELIFSGEILRQVTEIVKPGLKDKANNESIGRVVIGTVAGDIHDIGKDIVTFMLDINGFEVHDLGIDVPAEKFVKKIGETGAEIVGLSGFLTLSFDSMKHTIQTIEQAGLRQRVRVMIGGGQVDDKIREFAGADAYGRDAMAAVSLAKGWVRGR
jgi:5-methyltetrahydrofolate--homocysteine methyltransferase